MPEKFPPSERESNPFREGDLVQFRDDLSPEMQEILNEMLDLNMQYRVFRFVSSDDGGGSSVWLGPADVPPGTPIPERQLTPVQAAFVKRVSN